MSGGLTKRTKASQKDFLWSCLRSVENCFHVQLRRVLLLFCAVAYNSCH